MSEIAAAERANVYLEADPVPIGTVLGVDEVLALVHEMAQAPWLRLPTPTGESAAVRPTCIVAVVPCAEAD